MNNYKKSKTTEKFKVNFSKDTKNNFKSLREKQDISEQELNKITDKILKDCKVEGVQVFFSGTQPNTRANGKLKSKTMGRYTPRLRQINLYKYTAIRKQKRATKATLDTLLHEIAHHLDYKVLKLEKSIHTSGFFKRISNLKKDLLN